MTSYCNGADAAQQQSNRIDRCEILWRRIAASNEIAVFLQVGGQPIRRIDLAQLRLASKDNDIAPSPIITQQLLRYAST